MRRQVLGGLVAAAMMVGSVLAVRLLHLSSDETKTRTINVILGVLVIWFANGAPKQLAPLSAISCSPEQEQRLRRTSGFLIMAGGLVFSLAWLAAPLSLAFPLSIAALGGAVMLTLALCLLATRRRNA